MKKRNVILLSLAGLVALGVVVSGLVILLRHEPGFYARCAIPAGSERGQAAKRFSQKFTSGLVSPLLSDGKCDVTFTETEVNSYFAEDFLKFPDSETLRRQGITDPRVAFEKGLIRVGFRYGSAPWDTIMSFDFHIWMVPKEINLMAIEIVGRHAGALPISAQTLLDLMFDHIRGKEVDVTWYRHNGNPVALVRFQGSRARPTFQLRGVKVVDGSLTISGMSLESQAAAPQRPE